jgi:hypothetical protein
VSKLKVGRENSTSFAQLPNHVGLSARAAVANIRESTFVAIARAYLQRHVGLFLQRNSRVKERLTIIEMRRETEGERVAWLAHTRLLRRTTALVRARSRVRECLTSNRQHKAENRRLLLPVMISLRPWFVWRIPAITGYIFSHEMFRRTRATRCPRERAARTRCCHSEVVARAAEKRGAV